MIFPGENISYEPIPVFWFFCDLDTPFLFSAVPFQPAAETAGSYNLDNEKD
jgi:hypothetical protein